jgi:hypothetical protein
MFGLIRSLVELPLDVGFGVTNATLQAAAKSLGVTEQSLKKVIDSGGKDAEEILSLLASLDPGHDSKRR